MKKLLYLGILAASAFVASAQETPTITTAPKETTPAPKETAPAKETPPSNSFDAKNRFGLRITPQPTWFVSGDKNNIPAGAVMGFGFGLQYEKRFSEIAALVTGIGGDFEGGTYTVKNEPGSYQVWYWTDEAGELMSPTDTRGVGTTGYHLKERRINTAFVSIPLILKLSTNEYNGFKYFGMFGAEIGFRISAKAKDTYYGYTTYDSTGVVEHNGEFQEEGLNINEEASNIPARFGMNVGAGAEYRLGGSTSLFFSLNFFRNFTNFMDKESEFMVYKYEAGAYKHVRQNLMLSGLRINIGILF